jgi:O-acetylserine/cysteine efflux transporter
VCWAVNFVVVDVGLEAFPPLLFAAQRFGLTVFPAIFAGQFGLLSVALVCLAIAELGTIAAGRAHGVPLPAVALGVASAPRGAAGMS